MAASLSSPEGRNGKRESLQIARERMPKVNQIMQDWKNLHTGAFIILGKANAVESINRRITQKKMLCSTRQIAWNYLVWKWGKWKQWVKKTCVKCHIITKIINLRITGVSEGQEREKCAESPLRDLMIENSQNSGRGLDIWIHEVYRLSPIYQPQVPLQDTIRL